MTRPKFVFNCRLQVEPSGGPTETTVSSSFTPAHEIEFASFEKPVSIQVIEHMCSGHQYRTLKSGRKFVCIDNHGSTTELFITGDGARSQPPVVRGTTLE